MELYYRRDAKNKKGRDTRVELSKTGFRGSMQIVPVFCRKNT